MAKAKGKKKKDCEGQEREQKPARIPLPRRSRTSTRERAENRQARHERQAGRKASRLAAKCEALEKLLDAKGIDCAGVVISTMGARYRRLRRQARRNGLVGEPVKKRPEKRSESGEVDDVTEPESAQVPEITA